VKHCSFAAIPTQAAIEFVTKQQQHFDLSCAGDTLQMMWTVSLTQMPITHTRWMMI